MIHYKQFRDRYIRNGALENGVTIKEYEECSEDHDIVAAWWAEQEGFMRMGGMSKAWWNMVMKRQDTYGFISRWLRDNPQYARQWGHDLDWALAHVRRDAKAAMP